MSIFNAKRVMLVAKCCALLSSQSVASASLVPMQILQNSADPVHRVQVSGGSAGGTAGGGTAGGPEDVREEGGGNDATATASSLSPSQVGTATSVAIEIAGRICTRAPTNYRIDCLSAELAKAAENLPQNAVFGEAKAALQNASDQLRSISREYRNSTSPRVRVVSPETGKRGARPIVAVRDQQLRRANSEALQVLEETQTILLRSAENSSPRSGPYQEIAQALNSNKILLRS
ncbi:hypothetical protein [Pseudophaeobacter leonis]|uniref:hypothetical protein n=1 Tax=Pseudophaeobacter leonis TaxID=1144477 RepID=UPI00111C841D|nr:hypothetical protein [Pseudophaeobacter leonis]